MKKQEGFLEGVQKYEEEIAAMRNFVESSERQTTLSKQNTQQYEVPFYQITLHHPLRVL